MEEVSVSVEEFSSIYTEEEIAVEFGQFSIEKEISPRRYFDEVSNHLKIGIIGTVNVGKSSLFNIMTRSNHIYSPVENALFTTIDPCIATYTPTDKRMEYLQSCYPGAVHIPSQITVVDTAGLVQHSVREKQGVGASSIEAIRHCDIYIHLIQCMDSDSLAKYDSFPVDHPADLGLGKVHANFHPLRELMMVEQEFLQLDLQRVESMLRDIENTFPNLADVFATAEYLSFQYSLLLRLWQLITTEKRPEPPVNMGGNSSSNKQRKHAQYRTKLPKECKGQWIRSGNWDNKEREAITRYQLLTSKETVYAMNLSMIDYNRHHRRIHHPVKAATSSSNSNQGSLLPCIAEIEAYLTKRLESFPGNSGLTQVAIVPLSIALEQQLYDVEQEGGLAALADYLALNPYHLTATPRLLLEQSICMSLLNIIHYYTIDDRLVKAWILRRGSTVMEAAARQDVNIARNFIKVSVMNYEDFHEYEGDTLKLQMDGKIHNEGRKYVVNDGDLIEYFYRTPTGSVTSSSTVLK